MDIYQKVGGGKRYNLSSAERYVIKLIGIKSNRNCISSGEDKEEGST